MELSIYDIIRSPRVTTKGYRLNKEMKQLVLEVHVEANKPMIAEALKKLFNVEVEKIRTMVSKGKTRHVRRRAVAGVRKKIAIITLKEGQSVDMMDWTSGVSSPAETNSAASAA